MSFSDEFTRLQNDINSLMGNFSRRERRMMKDVFGDSSFCDPFLCGPAFTVPLLTDPTTTVGNAHMDGPCSGPCSSSSAVATQQNQLVPTQAGQLPLVTCKVNVEDKADKYIVTADVPSFDKANLKLNITDDNMLTISGEQTKEFVEESKDKHYLRKERSFGLVHRSLQLPKNADKSKITANYANGVLHINIGKCAKKEEKASIPIA
jgi:HSP20 family protein